MKFEDSLSKLRDIITELENVEIELDRAINIYEEGMKLFKYCEFKLESASLKIEKATKKNASKIEVTKFDFI